MALNFPANTDVLYLVSVALAGQRSWYFQSIVQTDRVSILILTLLNLKMFLVKNITRDICLYLAQSDVESTSDRRGAWR